MAAFVFSHKTPLLCPRIETVNKVFYRCLPTEEVNHPVVAVTAFRVESHFKRWNERGPREWVRVHHPSSVHTSGCRSLPEKVNVWPEGWGDRFGLILVLLIREGRKWDSNCWPRVHFNVIDVTKVSSNDKKFCVVNAGDRKSCSPCGYWCDADPGR